MEDLKISRRLFRCDKWESESRCHLKVVVSLNFKNKRPGAYIYVKVTSNVIFISSVVKLLGLAWSWAVWVANYFI